MRGFRIEPAEVEAAVLRHPDVAQAAVGVRGSDADTRLVAWYVPRHPDVAVTSAALRDVCTTHLPSAMVPAAFVPVPAVPLTPNGKINRAALPDPPSVAPAHDYVAPRSGVEEVVCEAWSRILGIARLGVHDDFFHAGGHSLLAPPAVAAVEDALERDIPLRTIFERPTPAGFAAALDDGSALARSTITRVDRSAGVPASFSQQRLWFLDQLAPGTSAYNVPLLFRLRGPLDVAALRRALAVLVARHETLRTRFEARAGRPVQIVEDDAEVHLVVEDVETAPDPEAALRDRLEAHARQPIPLDVAPLIRAHLVRVGADDHVLLCLMHHIVSDGWSLDIVFDEIAVCYSAFTAGEEPELPDLPVQYADFAVFQREQMSGERLDRELRYWREALAGAPAALELPTDRPRPPVQTFRGALHLTRIDSGTAAAVRRLGEREGATLYMVLLAAFDAFLARITGQHDIVVGSPIAGRNRPEIEGVIGFFVNTLAVRVDLAGDPSFAEVVRRVRRAALGAYAHQELPFDRVVEDLQPARDLAYTPVFQVMFALQNAPFDPPRMPGIVPEDITIDKGGTPTDLVVEVAEADGGLAVAFTYATDLFDPATIERFARWFVNVVRAAAADPERRLGELVLPGEDERRELLSLSRPPAAARPYPRDASVASLVARPVDPAAPAVVDDTGRITYDALIRRADDVAAQLRAVGVRPGDRVGVCIPRSAELWASCLGVWRAGAAYVPLDPEYPSDRLAFMLRDSVARVVVTTEGLAEVVAAGDDAPAAVVLSSTRRPNPRTVAPAATGGGDAVAYVMYTSGSTGQPKGIEVPHRAIARLVCNTDYVDVGPGDVVAQASNASFDAATFEVWGALVNGAALRVVDTTTLLSAPSLAKAIADDGITTLFLTTSLFNALVDDDPSCFAGLRTLLVGGEAADPHRFRRARRAGDPPARLLHAYGPTESTTFATWHEVTDVPSGATTVPIGAPIANTTAVVLDRWGSLAPLGVTGELHIGGDGLAHGYAGRPALTSSRFVPDQLSSGARLYRTGDLVRRRPGDGAIEFVGRVDEQVKIRGFRVEPGEIEAQLARHPQVSAAAVVAHTEASGVKRLVAYVAGDAPGSDVRAFLAHRLPDYMVPAAVVVLDRLPITPNGKVDRTALPAPPASRAETVAYVAPRTDTERVVVDVFAGLLGIERVGIDDDFFELGGHSLLAMQAVARLRESIGIDLSLRLLFEEPTAARLAEKLDELRAAGPRRPRPQLRPLPRRSRDR
nr:phosphopantetheine-binding domain-containing pro [uncultured bacterium]